MDKSSVGHLQVNVYSHNVTFYKDLFTFLGWTVVYEDAAMVGVEDKNGVSLWFAGSAKNCDNDYDGPGVNHLAVSVGAQADVDECVKYIKKIGVKALFETPRHRPEFCSDANSTYYQVMFESPDRILFEVVYTGPKEK